MGLSPDAFAAHDRLEKLSVSYNGGFPETITVTDENGNTIFEVLISNEFETIDVFKSDFGNNKFPSKSLINRQLPHLSGTNCIKKRTAVTCRCKK